MEYCLFTPFTGALPPEADVVRAARVHPGKAGTAVRRTGCRPSPPASCRGTPRGHNDPAARPGAPGGVREPYATSRRRIYGSTHATPQLAPDVSGIARVLPLLVAPGHRNRRTRHYCSTSSDDSCGPSVSGDEAESAGVTCGLCCPPRRGIHRQRCLRRSACIHRAAGRPQTCTSRQPSVRQPEPRPGIKAVVRAGCPGRYQHIRDSAY